MAEKYRRITLLPAALLLAGLACNFSAAPTAQPETGQPVVVEGPGTPIPAPESTTVPTADPLTGQPAVQTLDLESLPFGADISQNFSEHFVMSWEGAGLDGQALAQEWDFLTLWFTGPQAGYSSRIVVTQNGSIQTANETVVVGGQSYFFEEPGGCYIFPATQQDSSPADLFGGDLALVGEASLAESGLQVNGVLADRYTLSAGNLAFPEGFQPGDYNLESGDLYLARPGGYATRLILVGTADGRDFDYPGNANLIYTIDTVPLPDDARPRTPEGCSGAAVGGLDFPRTEDAFDIISLPEGLLYKSHMPLADIAALYRQEMPAQGWTPLEEDIFEELATLTFEKDGSLLTVNAVLNEGQVNVALLIEP